MKRAPKPAGWAKRAALLLPAALALGLLALHASHPVVRMRRRIMLELDDGELPGGSITVLPGGELSAAWQQQQQSAALSAAAAARHHSRLTLPGQGMLGLEAWQGRDGPLQRKQQHLEHPLGQGAGGAPPAAPQFVRYEPSQWETEWRTSAKLLQDNPALVCGTMLQEAPRTRAWVNATTQGLAHLRAPTGGGNLPLDPTVFSRFTYLDPLSGQEFGVWIEPLVGHFRHPYNPAPCVPPGMPPLPIQDRSYIMLHGITQQQFQRLYPGKKYLLDLGTADFESSLGWFLQNYGAWGVQFDEIWAWEVETMPAREYWAHVPSETLPHLHFYNIPVTVDATHPDNPINIIRSIYKPGDFVVVKLDIDNTPLESQLIEQVRRDPKAIAMISEMMFEMHYDHPDMALCFGHPNATWADVAALFGELRSNGLRLHYWP